MSKRDKVLSLLGGITDPVMRVDIATTMDYLMDLFSSGGANEAQIRDSLFEICQTVISYTHPELTEEEVRKKSAVMANELVKSFKVETIRRRTMARLRIPPSPPI